MEQNGYRGMEPTIMLNVHIPQAAWPTVGPRAIIAIAYVTLMLPGTTEFYINMIPSDIQHPPEEFACCYITTDGTCPLRAPLSPTGAISTATE